MAFKLEINNVSLRYKQFEALKDISFMIGKEGIYGLVGRNGAGKTTLLSLIASFVEPSSGTIKIDGENPFENARIMSEVNFIFEADYKEEHDSPLDYFEFQERYRPNFDMPYAKELAAKFKLPLDKSIYKLSDGKQSALNVILGLASRSRITIFDEAYRGMDAPTRELFYKELLNDQERHPRVMILSTHLVSEMEYLFDHVLIIDDGKLLINEPYDEVVSRGVTFTGEDAMVDVLTRELNRIHSEQLGRTKAVMVYGEVSESLLLEAEQSGVEISTVTLQNLFIHLTGEED
ncbi:ABC transporter ATP-binding protein [Alkalihalophilus marmarensis]|uniref:ABC transporter n=1 Tax=Alkalihalophilus marmarensis DSM 21297 TaxID=1188261 RepID=U6SSX7_9BACI|nr:ABC transporter ATP-binding protein [Alkalihalophilus marmarensis]ERN54005.1 ABC transporter [Alkalihalophilus marmarensis DSM 21297]MCM3488176.1 ABC transporter ATP-binding protein [Alkalihalophilus marmarensis]